MTPPAVPPLAITEVLANPAGPEPQQEYVELRNLGDADVALEGLRLADSKGGDDLPPETLAAGAYALVVTSTYDPAAGPDPPPRPGTLLVRVDTRLGSDGLSNGGEAVQLLQGEAVVSSYGGWVAVSAGSWNGKAVHRLVQSACDAPGGVEPHPAATHARQRSAREPTCPRKFCCPGGGHGYDRRHVRAQPVDEDQAQERGFRLQEVEGLDQAHQRADALGPPGRR